MRSGRTVLRTPRLLLREWRDDDTEPFGRLNADPAVMRYLGGPMTRDASDALFERLREQMAAQPFGRWAVEHRESGSFLGFLGLGHHPVAPEAPEIGWRIGSAWWRQGLATEGATAVRDHGFGPLVLDRIVSVTVPENVASLAVMRRIGMTPLAVREVSVPEDEHLPVVVWHLTREGWHRHHDRVLTDPLDLVRATCLALPEVTERLSHGAPSFFVRDKKTFVMFMDDHHGDGRLAVWCAAPPGAQEEMVAQDPARFFRPPYVGHRGWLGVRVDGRPDWAEVEAVIKEAYRTVAPKSLVARLDER